MHKVYGLHSGNYLFLSVILCAFVMKNGNTRQLLGGSAPYVNQPKSVKKFYFVVQYSD